VKSSARLGILLPAHISTSWQGKDTWRHRNLLKKRSRHSDGDQTTAGTTKWPRGQLVVPLPIEQEERRGTSTPAVSISRWLHGPASRDSGPMVYWWGARGRGCRTRMCCMERSTAYASRGGTQSSSVVKRCRPIRILHLDKDPQLDPSGRPQMLSSKPIGECPGYTALGSVFARPSRLYRPPSHIWFAALRHRRALQVLAGADRPLLMVCKASLSPPVPAIAQITRHQRMKLIDRTRLQPTYSCVFQTMRKAHIRETLTRQRWSEGCSRLRPADRNFIHLAMLHGLHSVKALG